MNRATAAKIVDAIIVEMSGRMGLGDEWDGIDEEVQAEIREDWITIVLEESETR